MKRLRRIIFNGLTVMSLLLCAFSCALWVRSMRGGDVLIYSQPEGRYHRLLSIGGDLRWQTAPHYPYPQSGLRWRQFQRGASTWNPPKTTASDGREWSTTPYAGEQPMVAQAQIAVPYAVLAGVTALPLFGHLAWKMWTAGKRRKRLAAGLCPTCGYDLRATPDRCPECGAAATAATAR